MTTCWYLIEGVNPEPWTAPTYFGQGRGKRAVANPQLVAYQNALAEAVMTIRPDVQPVTGDIAFDLWIWRELEQYTTASGRKQTRHRADRSNILKATEDALEAHKSREYHPEAILFENDKQIVDGTTTIVEQAVGIEPCIVMRVRPAGTRNAAVGARETMLARGVKWMELT